jgi:hypothetical protein
MRTKAAAAGRLAAAAFVVRKFISKASSRQKNSPDPFQGAQRKNRALR